MYNNPHLSLGLGQTAVTQPGMLDRLTTAFTGLATTGMTVYAQIERAKAAIRARRRAAEQEAMVREAETEAARQAAQVIAQRRIQAAQQAQAGVMGMDTNTLLLLGGGALVLMMVPMMMGRRKSR